MMNKFTHIDKNGDVKMVNISKKEKTRRIAEAYAEVFMSEKTLKLIYNKKIPKGNVFTAAKLAGIMAAKKTPEIIPLCHSLNLTNIEINIDIDKSNKKVNIISICETENGTGVEMEALTAVSCAALTIYDMCKSVDKNIIITNIKLLKKIGGKSDLK